MNIFKRQNIGRGVTLKNFISEVKQTSMFINDLNNNFYEEFLGCFVVVRRFATRAELVGEIFNQTKKNVENAMFEREFNCTQ